MPTFEREAAAAGVQDPRVLAAVAAVPRELFTGARARPRDVARDAPVPVDCDQTTSQPSLVALMVEALGLTGTERVLEVGTGPGYEAAVLGRLAAEVWTVERHPRLAEAAAANLAATGAANVHVVVGDGRAGVPENAPYDAILIAAQTARVPSALAAQLVEGGRMVVPLGDTWLQEAVLLRRHDGALRRVRTIAQVLFVPLVGDS